MLETRSGILSLKLLILMLYLIFNCVTFCVNCINLTEVFYSDKETTEENILSSNETCNEQEIPYSNRTNLPDKNNGQNNKHLTKFSETQNKEELFKIFNGKRTEKIKNMKHLTEIKNGFNDDESVSADETDESNYIKASISNVPRQNNDFQQRNLKFYNPESKSSNNYENEIKISNYVSISANFSVENDFQYHNETIRGNTELMQQFHKDIYIFAKIRLLQVNETSAFEPDLVSRAFFNETAYRTGKTRKSIDNKYGAQMLGGNISKIGHDILIDTFKKKYPVKSWLSFGVFTEEYLYKINAHWLGFEPPFHSSHYVLAVLYCIVMTIGVCGNCLVIFMFLRCRSLRVPANTLVINLAVSDFFMLIKMPIFIFNSVYFGPVLGEPGCQLYGFVGGLTGTVSIMTLAAIALDRYYAIVHPLDPLRKTTRLRARLSVLFTWCYGCVFASLPLTGLGLNRYVPEGYLTSCSFDYLTSDLNSRIFIFTFFVAAWVIPFSVITVCYYGILREVIKTGSASCRHGQEVEKRKTEIRLAGMVIGVIGLWFLAWTPYAIVALLGIFGFPHLISPLGSMLPALLCKSASCIDPYVYAVTHPRFRREITKLFLPRKRKMSHHYQSRKYQTEASRVSSIYMQRQDSFNEIELQELKITPLQNIQQPRRKTWFLSKIPLPIMKYNASNPRCKSLQDSKKSLSNSYSIANSSPF